jgi:hypothetical protein
MKDLYDSDMQSFIMKYFISSIMIKSYEIAIVDIGFLKNQYTQYDLNIYLL